jgi:hypothetical protein
VVPLQSDKVSGAEGFIGRLDGAPLEGLGAERVGPAAWRVPELAIQEPMTEAGMSNFPGLSVNSFGSAPTATKCNARSPTTFDDGVTFAMFPSMSLAAAYMSSICSNFSPSPTHGLLAQIGELSAGIS